MPFEFGDGSPDYEFEKSTRRIGGAYGWPADISEEDALARLLVLNLDRSR